VCRSLRKWEKDCYLPGEGRRPRAWFEPTAQLGFDETFPSSGWALSRRGTWGKLVSSCDDDDVNSSSSSGDDDGGDDEKQTLTLTVGGTATATNNNGCSSANKPPAGPRPSVDPAAVGAVLSLGASSASSSSSSSTPARDDRPEEEVGVGRIDGAGVQTDRSPQP
jgi:hypothetical protein